MVKRGLKLALVLTLLLSVLGALAPARACLERVNCPGDPLHDPVPDPPNLGNVAGLKPGGVPLRASDTARIFRAVGYPLKNVKLVWVNTPAGKKAVPVASASAAATAASGDIGYHFWGGGDVYTRGGLAYSYYWYVRWWTDSRHRKVTYLDYTECRDSEYDAVAEWACGTRMSHSDAPPDVSTPEERAKWEFGYKYWSPPAKPTWHYRETIEAHVTKDGGIYGTHYTWDDYG